MGIFRRRKNEDEPSNSNREILDVSSLPLPPSYDELSPHEVPIGEEDFDRLEEFFDKQEDYYKGLSDQALEAGKEESGKILLEWSQRVPELYQLIRDNTRIITEEKFDQVVEDMKQEAQEFVGDDDFLFMLHGKDLEEAKKHSAYYLAIKMGVPEERMIARDGLDDDDIKKRLENGAKLLIVDDAAYSGQNLWEFYQLPLEWAGIELVKDQLFVGLVGCTQSAASKISDRFGDVAKFFCGLKIPQVKEFFEEDDLRILRFMHRPENDGRSMQITSDRNNVLTMLWQKVPDNFLQALRKLRNKGEGGIVYSGYLVNDLPDGIHPDYRDGDQFMFS